MNKINKIFVWNSILRLIKPYKRKIAFIFSISLLATIITLLEPLIYREAVNDIAGLYVQRAKNEINSEVGGQIETDEAPIINFIKSKINDEAKNEAPAVSHHVIQNSKHRIKEPHTSEHVAARTHYEAYNTLVWAVILLFIINVLGLIFWRIGENLNVKLSCTIERNFIRSTLTHVLHLPLEFFTKKSSSTIHKQIDQSEEISSTVSLFTKDIFPEMVNLGGIIAIMLYQNYILTLLALSILPFYILITVKSTRKLEKSLAGYYEKWEDVSSKMQDTLRGIKTVKLSVAEEREVNKLDQQAQSAYLDYVNRSYLSNKYAFWQILLTHLSTAIVLTYGGYLALSHKLTPGDVVMFVAYLDMLYRPIDRLAEIWSEVQQNVTSVSRAFNLLDNNAEEKKGRELIISNGEIEFKNVKFGYTENRVILNNLSFKINAHQVTAFVGSSGAGKTTTIDLIMKLYEPNSGAILIDGQQLSELDSNSVRRKIGLVAADGSIFQGSLEDNIRFKNVEASSEEVIASLAAAGLTSTLVRLPDGLKSNIGEDGFGLSVGERQRIQIARILLSKPSILILDEATANLDFTNEEEILNTIDTLKKSTTIIIIAHRYSMVKDADKVIVLENGSILEEGSPGELIKNGRWFAEFSTSGKDDEIEDASEQLDDELEDEDDEE